MLKVVFRTASGWNLIKCSGGAALMFICLFPLMQAKQANASVTFGSQRHVTHAKILTQARTYTQLTEKHAFYHRKPMKSTHGLSFSKKKERHKPIRRIAEHTDTICNNYSSYIMKLIIIALCILCPVCININQIQKAFQTFFPTNAFIFCIKFFMPLCLQQNQ